MPRVVSPLNSGSRRRNLLIPTTSFPVGVFKQINYTTRHLPNLSVARAETADIQQNRFYTDYHKDGARYTRRWQERRRTKSREGLGSFKRSSLVNVVIIDESSDFGGQLSSFASALKKMLIYLFLQKGENIIYSIGYFRRRSPVDLYTRSLS